MVAGGRLAAPLSFSNKVTLVRTPLKIEGSSVLGNVVEVEAGRVGKVGGLLARIGLPRGLLVPL